MYHLGSPFQVLFSWYLLNYLAAAVVSPLFRGRPEYRHLWLVSERGTDAQDNGLYFYRYLRREHPEVTHAICCLRIPPTGVFSPRTTG